MWNAKTQVVLLMTRVTNVKPSTTVAWLVHVHAIARSPAVHSTPLKRSDVGRGRNVDENLETPPSQLAEVQFLVKPNIKLWELLVEPLAFSLLAGE